MRKQFLWLDKAGFHYNAPGNVSIGPGSKGTVFFWYHPATWIASDQPIWEARGDGGNYLRVGFTGPARLSFVSCSNNVGFPLHWDNFFIQDYNRWMPVVCTWDFSVAGAGKLRLYVDGQEAAVRVDNAQAPLMEAMQMYLGARADTAAVGLDGYLDNVAVWDGVMTAAQVQALKMGASSYAERQAARRRRPRQSDGTGIMTILATFDGRYDADFAAGDPTAQWQVGPEGYDQFARIDDGSRCRGRRYAFRFGVPRHDNSDDDRVPVRAVLELLRNDGASQFTSLVDRSGYSEINVSQLKPMGNQGQGVGWLRTGIDPGSPLRPATIRMRVNLPDATNPKQTKICLGPMTYISGGMHGNNFGTWGSGETFTVVADGGNSVAAFKTSLTARSSDYWKGAEVSFRSGTCAGVRLKVAGYEPATGVVTLAGALPAIPGANDEGLVDFRGRIIPTSNPYNETQSMDAWLWEQYEEDRPWIELEAVYGANSGSSFGRYQRGRTAWMDMTGDRSDALGRAIMFGRNAWELPTSFSCNILIESLIVEGPGSYQVMSPEDSRANRSFELADTFLLRDLTNSHSCRVWRTENCGWASATPTVNADAAAALADLQAAGTWRQSAIFCRKVSPWDESDAVVAVIRGTGPDGLKQLGYVRGTWDEATGRIRWDDETPPAGRSNPFLPLSALKPGEATDSTWGLNADPGLSQIFQTPDGTWSLLVLGNEDNPDHYYAHALHGAADRWSFDPAKHWWANNPVVPGFGGVDMIPPMFGGINVFGNRDAEWIVAHNPYARDAGRRFLGYARYKTILPLGGAIATNRRPGAGWTSPDLRSFYLLPHGTAASPIGIGELYTLCPYAVSDDVTGMLVQYYGGVTRLWASDDDRHFQQVVYSFLPDSNPLDVFRLGDRRIYYYISDGKINFGSQGYDRETFYQLNAGQTAGRVETAALVKPAAGWGQLVVNVAPEQGALRVEVVDARTDEALPGFGAEDCDGLSDGVRQLVTWAATDLTALTADAIRLRFHFARANATDAGPKLYGWQMAEPAAMERPRVSGLQVEGLVNPAGIMSRTPELGWQYEDPQERTQSAYQVLVASSQSKPDAHEGDLWDSGVRAGSDTQVTYGGVALSDQTTYFWKVRAQNTEGVWSEEW